MMQYTIHNNQLCVYNLMYLVGKYQWDNLKRFNGLNVVIPHAPNRHATVTFESIRADIRERVIEVLGSPNAHAGNTERFIDTIRKDINAFNYFTEKSLTREKINLYTNDASILNAIIGLELKHLQMGKRNNDYIREAITESKIINDLYPNTLPWSEKRLKMKLEGNGKNIGYKKGKYESLIHRGTGNDNRRKVTKKLEKLIIYLKARLNKPYDKKVVEAYEDWLLGGFDFFDNKTGELLFDRNNFVSKDGEFMTINEKTVRYYVNKPDNAAVIDKLTMTFHDYNNAQRPIAFRDNVIMSNSKISLDDFDLPKCDQGFRPKAYAAFDIGSEAVIGYSFSRKKDQKLFEDCMLNTMRFIHTNGLGMPAEIEVENHLVKEYFAVLEQMFTFMRVCAPTNSREKRAERRIRALKYENIKNHIIGVGRYHLRLKANRVDINRVNDEDIETMHPYDEVLTAVELAIKEYNNAPHPKQDVYPGMSRMDVYLKNQNPDLKPFKPQSAAHYFGQSVSFPVNIYNNQYVKAANDFYQLPSPELMEYFPDKKAYVCWIAEPDGSVPEVYLYARRDGTVTEYREVTQEMYMCTCKKIQKFKDAQIEMTDEDRAIMAEQQKYAAKYDKIVADKEEEIKRIAKVFETGNEEVREVLPPPPQDPFDEINKDFENEEMFAYSPSAIDDL